MYWSMFAQMSRFFENFCQNNNVASGKANSTQQYLLALLGKWKRAVDIGQMLVLY